jgi:hypothetical protein
MAHAAKEPDFLGENFVLATCLLVAVVENEDFGQWLKNKAAGGEI